MIWHILSSIIYGGWPSQNTGRDKIELRTSAIRPWPAQGAVKVLLRTDLNLVGSILIALCGFCPEYSTSAFSLRNNLVIVL